MTTFVKQVMYFSPRHAFLRISISFSKYLLSSLQAPRHSGLLLLSVWGARTPCPRLARLPRAPRKPRC